MSNTGPAVNACFFLYSGDSLFSSGFGPGAFGEVGIAGAFRAGDVGFGYPVGCIRFGGTIAPFVASGVRPFGSSVCDFDGKEMTCSRNGAE